jgi:hypothetical protein
MLEFIKNIITKYKERRAEYKILKAFELLDKLSKDGVYYSEVPTEEQEIALLNDIKEDNKQKYLH